MAQGAPAFLYCFLFSQDRGDWCGWDEQGHVGCGDDLDELDVFGGLSPVEAEEHNGKNEMDKNIEAFLCNHCGLVQKKKITG